jgi:hypothetical protein
MENCYFNGGCAPAGLIFDDDEVFEESYGRRLVPATPFMCGDTTHFVATIMH